MGQDGTWLPKAKVASPLVNLFDTIMTLDLKQLFLCLSTHLVIHFASRAPRSFLHLCFESPVKPNTEFNPEFRKELWVDLPPNTPLGLSSALRRDDEVQDINSIALKFKVVIFILLRLKMRCYTFRKEWERNTRNLFPRNKFPDQSLWDNYQKRNKRNTVKWEKQIFEEKHNWQYALVATSQSSTWDIRAMKYFSSEKHQC